MSLFEKIKSRKINLNEQTFSDRQRSDMKKLLNKNFGTKEISKKTADTQKNLSKANKEVFNVTGKSAVRDAKKYASGEYPKIGGGTRIGSKSKGSGAETGAKVNLNTTSVKKSKGTTPVKVNITKPIKQSEVSKKAKKFTADVNKANVKRQETVANRKYFRGRKAVRTKDASKYKATGSIARGVYKPQFFGDVVPRSTYKSSPVGQRAYDFEKMKIDARDQKRAADKLDRKLDKSLMKDGKYPKELQKAMQKDGITKPSQAVRRAAKETGDKLRAGDPKAKKEVFDTMDRQFKKMSKAQQNRELSSIIKTQTAKGRKFNPKTGNFEDPLGFEQQARKQRSKKVFPGDKSGAYKQAKDDLAARTGFKGAKTRTGAGKTKTITGLKADEKNPFVKTSVRKGRAADLGGDIFDAPKVTDKDFKKSLKDVDKEGIKLRKARAQAFKDVQTDPDFKGQLSGSKPTFTKKSTPFVKPSDPFKGATGKASDISIVKKFRFTPKTAAASQSAKKVETGLAKAKKTFKTFSGELENIKKTKGVNQADVSRKAKEFSQSISNKVQMRSGATNVEPKTISKKIPPKPSSTPPTDPPGKLVQGRDFPSKKAYDAKISKQVKILRDKADRLRTKQIKLAKTNPAKGTPEYETRRTGVKKIGARMKQRRVTADALEKSLKRQGVKGPTSMLPVVSGTGANQKVDAFGGKTFKQFYKDAGVSKREPIKPIKPIEQIKDTTRNINKKYSPNTGNLGNTAFNQNVRGVYKKIPKALRGKNLYRIGKAVAKNPYVATAVGLGLGGYAAYKGIKALTNKPKVRTLKTSDLKSKKTGSTVTYGTGEFKGKPVRFDALGLGFTKKKGVEKKKPTYQDFQSGKYTFK